MLSATELSASLEDYLEAIYHTIEEKRVARAKDIVKRLGVGSSSVTGALHALGDRDLINYVPYDVVTLTTAGERVAREIVRKHEALRDFFVKVLGVDPKEAETGACKMEHAVSRAILERFIEFVEFVELCPRGGPEWIEAFKDHCKHSAVLSDCEKCITNCLKEYKGRTISGGADDDTSVRLSDLAVGQKGRITECTLSHDRDEQMAGMGVGVGAVVEMEQGDDRTNTIDVKVKGYHLSLSMAEAEGIRVEPL